MSTQSPFFFQQFRKADGTPLENGKLYTYVTESVIPKAIFYDREETLACPNPLPLDDSGFVPQYYLGSGLYTFVLKDNLDQTVATRDNIEGVLGSSQVFSLVGNYLPLSGGTVWNKIGFKTTEESTKEAQIYKFDYQGQEALHYDVSGFNSSHRFTVDDSEGNPTTIFVVQNTTRSYFNGGLNVHDGFSTDNFTIIGDPGHKFVMADGTLEDFSGNFLPLSGGSMNKNAEVSFVSSAAETSSVGVPTSISIVRQYNQNQNAFAGIDIENHTGFGLKITNEDDSLYSAARLINNADPEKEHSSYALELTGPGRSLYAENDAEFYGNIFSNKLGTGIVKAVNGILTSGTSADYGLFSTGAVYLPELTDLGGAFIVQQGSYRLYSTNNFTGELKQYDNVTGGYFVPDDNIESYLVCNYNSGSPILQLITDKTLINNSSIILLYTVWRQGSVIHSVGYDSLALGLGNKTENYIRNTQMYKKSIDGGLALSEDGSRHIIVTSAVVYSSVVPQNVYSFTSTTDQLTLVSGGVYTDQTQYDNTNYNGGVLTNNKFGTRWFFRSIGDVKQVFYVLGGQYNSVELAKLETIPTIPTLLKDHCVLIGRIIIQKSAASGLVENVSDVSFSTSQVQNHNDLANIQGGASGEYYHLTSSEYASINNLSALQEPTGFADRNQTISFNNSTRTFNISAAGGFNFFYRGQKFSKTSDSIVLTTATSDANYFIWYTSAGILTATQTPWDLSTSVQVAYIYYNGSKLVMFGEERHGCVMDWATHRYAHKNFGTQYTSGFTINYTLNNDSIAYIGMSNGTISDEDIELNITNGTKDTYLSQPLSTSAQIPVYYRDFLAQGVWNRDNATTLPYKNTGTTGISYNNSSSQTLVQNNYYVAYWIFATDNINEPIIAIQGQREDSSLSNAQLNATFSSLDLTDFPSQEAKLLYRLILKTSTTYTGNTYRVQIADVTDYRLQNINLTLNTSNQYLPLAGGTLTGTLGLPEAILRQYSGNSNYFSIYGSSVVAGNSNYGLLIAKDGVSSYLNGTQKAGLAINNVDQLLVTSAGVSANFISINNYPVGYTLFSSAYAISGLAGGTNRQILSVSIPAGLLNTRSLRITFNYLISNAGSHSSYISAGLGGLTYADSTLGCGSSGTTNGKCEIRYTALVTGASGKVGQVASCVYKDSLGMNQTTQNYIGSEFSSLNLNNAQTLTLLLIDNSASSTIYVYQPLIEVL